MVIALYVEFKSYSKKRLFKSIPVQSSLAVHKLVPNNDDLIVVSTARFRPMFDVLYINVN